MPTNQWIIEVSNPSSYERSDYVQLDLDKLGVPAELDERKLTLYQLMDGGEERAIPYQIDYPFGEALRTRVMTFFAAGMPGGEDDYNLCSATFELRAEEPQLVPIPQDLDIAYYYEDRQPEEPEDGYSPRWDAKRVAKAVKLISDSVEVNFQLLAYPTPEGSPSAGAVTGIDMSRMEDRLGSRQVLAPFHFRDPEKLWGQVTKLVLFPLPWEHHWFHSVKVCDQAYSIVWSRSGPIRAIVTLRSSPFTICYDGQPFFANPGVVKVTAYLYRVLYVYPGPDNPYYTEEMFVRTEEGNALLTFRPYYRSKLPFVKTLHDLKLVDIKRFEHIPDYFAVWSRFTAYQFLGYGFAADSHVRRVHIEGDEIRWRLALCRSCRAIHYLMVEPTPHFDPFHEIGHRGWYERVFKPLRPYDTSLWFPPPLEHIDDEDENG